MAPAASAPNVSTALAIFVKTPGLSPVKTRLAASIGVNAAERFHQLAAAAVQAVARAAMPEVTPFWAVAEADAVDQPPWTGLPTTWQGEGTLGERLHRVCTHLHGQHGHVLMIGADSPQLSPKLLRQAAAALHTGPDPFVLGRAEDGGFWLFGSRLPVPKAAWVTPRYSSPTTAEELIAALASLGSIASIPPLVDVDRVDDLHVLLRALDALANPLPEQSALRDWLREDEPLANPVRAPR